MHLFKILEKVDLELKIGRSRPGMSQMHQIVRENCGKCPLKNYFLPNRTANAR